MKSPIIQLIPINIIAHPDRKSQHRCGICEKKSSRYDNGGGTRKWRCLDTGEAKAYVVAEAPRVCCKKHGVVTAFVPWARHKSRFCSSFEDTVAWLAVNSTKKCVAELMRIEWHTVGEIISRVYKELEKSLRNALITLSISELTRQATRRGTSI